MESKFALLYICKEVNIYILLRCYYRVNDPLKGCDDMEGRLDNGSERRTGVGGMKE